MPSGDHSVSSARIFLTTHWSVVLSAKAGSPDHADAALEKLCRDYWWPLYAYVRRVGNAEADAKDLTQEFFHRLLAKNFLHAVDPKKGKFRSFLLAAMQHFLAKEWRRSHTQKRGGQFAFLSVDDGAAERMYLQVSKSAASPETIFEREWAMTLLERAVNRLRDEYVQTGKEEWFHETKIFLTGERNSVPHAELAKKLGTSEAALKVSVSRMRKRYGEVIREEIANTVATPEEIDEELQALFAALS